MALESDEIFKFDKKEALAKRASFLSTILDLLTDVDKNLLRLSLNGTFALIEKPYFLHYLLIFQGINRNTAMRQLKITKSITNRESQSWKNTFRKLDVKN